MTTRTAQQPWIVSPDDHLVEPPNLWTSRLPKRHQEKGPRNIRENGKNIFADGDAIYTKFDEGLPADVWYYEDFRVPQVYPASCVGYDLVEVKMDVMTYDAMRPGCYDPKRRIEDMDIASIQASACFPNQFTQFAGQRFNSAKDKELALLCVKAYNDFVIDEWAGGSDGRLIPVAITPLWDVALGVAEVERVAARGVRTISFTEIPPFLGLPSLHSRYWDPLLAACSRADVSIMMHIGSSSRMPVTSPDVPAAEQNCLGAVNSELALLDWLFSGAFERFPSLAVCFAEAQIGWIPYILERADYVWQRNASWSDLRDVVPNPPSTYFRGHVYCTFFSDEFGIENLEVIGPENVMFETDYPHQDTNWPTSLEVGLKATNSVTPGVREDVLRNNALRFLRCTDPMSYSAVAAESTELDGIDTRG